MPVRHVTDDVIIAFLACVNHSEKGWLGLHACISWSQYYIQNQTLWNRWRISVHKWVIHLRTDNGDNFIGYQNLDAFDADNIDGWKATDLPKM